MAGPAGTKVEGETITLGAAVSETGNYYDDESTAARTAELLERLIQQGGIDYILGPYGSGPATAMASVVEKNGVPMIEANGAWRSFRRRTAPVGDLACPDHGARHIACRRALDRLGAAVP